jgi:phage-related tail fiber protein
LGTPLALTAMGVGDGNGITPIPTRQQTSLVNEVRRQPLNQLLIDPKNSNYIIAEQVIPEHEGGWWIREIGLYDEAGNLCAVSNAPPTYKPVLTEGSGRTQVIRMVLMINEGHTQAITLKTDPSIVLATHEYVINVMTKHIQLEDPHPQYATRQFVNSAVLLSMPAGCVMFFACRDAPNGWLKCNGAAISRTIYASLFDAIGSTFGNGDGSTTFNLPDLRGEFLRGWDDERGIDNKRNFGSWQAPSLITASIGPDSIQNLVVERIDANLATADEFNSAMQTDNIVDADYGKGLQGYSYKYGLTASYTGNNAGYPIDIRCNRPLNHNHCFTAGGSRPRNI